MALFQPTNVTPSAFGELGNGVVDASDNLVVSWQINGNSAMTAFSIAIYKNDAASTQIYSTGKLTSGCPFYGVDGAGNIKLFNYSIPASTLSGLTAWSNGSEYKLVITQYWSDTEYVTQTSASAFITRAKPIMLLDPLPMILEETEPTIHDISYTFGATYYQAQNDALNWVRWVLTDSDGTTVKDTGNIYGTAELSFTHNGLISGKNYYIRCLAQTENGVTADTGNVYFEVSYSTTPISGEVTACAVPSLSGVKVTWPAARNISGTGSGTYSLSDGIISMNAGSSVYWNTDTGSAMNLTNPWTIVWRGYTDTLTTSSQLFNANDGGLALKPRSLRSGESPLVWASVTSPVGFTGYANSIAYGGGVFVAIEGSSSSGGVGGVCAKSTDDGMTWNVVNMPDAYWANVAYGNGVFVAISSTMAAYSIDSGDTWKSVSIPDTFGKMTDIAYGGGYFVCTSAASNDVIYSANNGKTWTAVTIPNTAAAGYRVVYGNGRFLATNIYATSNAYSTNGGKTWTLTENPATGGMYNVAWSGTYFVAADSNDPTKFYRSTTGLGGSWTTVTATGAPDGAAMNVAYGGGKFLAWDVSGTAQDMLLYSTDEGATWSSTSFGYSGIRTAVAYGYSHFAAAGSGFDVSFPALGFALTVSGTTLLQPSVAKTEELIFVCAQDSSGNITLSVGYFQGGKSILTGVMSWSKASTAINITKLSMAGAQRCDYLLVLYGTGFESRFTNYPAYHPQFNYQTQFFADFIDDLDAGPLGSSQSVSGVLVYRQKEGDSELVQVAVMPSSSRELIDCGARSQEAVRYLIYSIFSASGTSVLTTEYVTPCFWDWALLSCATDEDGVCHPQEIFRFGKNLSTGAISNNGGANLLKNFTRYPTVQTLPYNYASGSLTSLIGSTAAGVYSDTRALRDAIYAVTENADAVFLKSRKGDLYKVVISGSISMSTMDNTRQQAQAATIPWTEIAGADDAQVVITPDDGLWTDD